MTVDLPPEDAMDSFGESVGRLVRSMYGSRYEPQVWQRVPCNKNTNFDVCMRMFYIQAFIVMRTVFALTWSMWTTCLHMLARPVLVERRSWGNGTG